MSQPTPILSLQGVHKYFKAGRKTIRVLQDVSLEVAEGEIVCLVGESGCGKTTTGKIIAGLAAPTAGKVFFEGRDVSQLRGEDFRAYRRAVQIVHQDPYASLNPTQTLYRMLSFPLFRHRLVRNALSARSRAGAAATGGLDPARRFHR